jgi:hypothetical protein
MNLIIPCAGKSTRFFDSRPKWLFTNPNGKLMIQEAISNLDLSNITNVYFCFLKEHLELVNINEIIIKSWFNNIITNNININILILDESTKSQSETIIKIIDHFNIKGNIFIKDCDNTFNFSIIPGNYVCYNNISNQTKNILGKSYIQTNNINEILNIVEKNIISNKFCVGGYSFLDCNEFKKTYIQINNNLISNNRTNEEIYISHIIKQMIINNTIFFSHLITKYFDWGTIDEWKKYCKMFKTIFIDLDGTLVKNSGQYFGEIWGTTDILENNVEYIRELKKTQFIYIIITTSRKSDFKQVTIEQLNKFNIPYDQIIFDLPHCTRYLINDFANTNSYPSAVAINLSRNSDNLKSFLS